jgi:hypothetical protein
MDAFPLLFNPRAGRGQNAGDLERAFREAGLEPAVEEVAADDLRARLDSLRGAPRVAVAGGDGTMQTAAAALRGSPPDTSPTSRGASGSIRPRARRRRPRPARAAPRPWAWSPTAASASS